MKSLTFVKPGHVEWREVVAPVIDSGLQAIVRPLVIGRCDLDVAFIQGLLPMPQGAEIGHEIIGEVTEIGDLVTSVSIGDRVIVPSQISCGKCRNCRRGFTGRCQTVPFGASYGMGREGNFGGGAADLVKVPFADAMLFGLPANVLPLDWIGVADLVQDAYRAVGPQLMERPGARVLVIGGNPSVIGIYAAGLAVALGASEVDYYDSDQARLKLAERYGANIIDRNNSEPVGTYEIVVDSSIDSLALIEAFRFTEPEGHLTSVTIHLEEKRQVPFTEAYHKGLFYRTARPNCRQYMSEVGELCCAGHFDPKLINARVYDFDDAPEAWLDKGIRVVAARN